MFSFRKDKVGFFSGLTLIILCGGTFIATLVLVIVGAVQGDYSMFLWPIRWVLCGCWLGCIATVLTRVYILDWQMKQRRLAPPATPGPEAGVTVPVLTPEMEVARARADQERYRAIGAIGVATVLGVASALGIVSVLSASVPSLPGAAPLQIVAWSVGGGVILVVVLLCFVGLWHRESNWLQPPASSRETVPTGVQEHRTST